MKLLKGWMALSALGLAAITCTTFAESEHGTRVPQRIAQQKNPFPPNDKNLSAGKALYAKHCVECHGTAGKGDGKRAPDCDPAPTDLTEAAVSRQPDGVLYWKITRGRRPMPSFEKMMSDDDRWLVVLHMRTLARRQQDEGGK